MKPEEINHQAYQYAQAISSQLEEICFPLFKTNIKTFAYFRFFNDGKYLAFCNNLPWLAYCLQNVHSNEGTSLGQEIGHVPEDNYHCYLWPTVKTDYLMSALYEFNIWNGLSIFKQREDSIELWGFAADRQAGNMQNFYIENVEFFKDFTAFFNMSATKLITPNKKNLAMYRDYKPPLILDTYETKMINEFIQATPIKKRPIILSNGEAFLSTKELQCLNFLAAGKTAKQIANAMNISARTIEKHFENIKHKINVHDKASLLKVYKNSVLYWL